MIFQDFQAHKNKTRLFCCIFSFKVVNLHSEKSMDLK